MTSSLIAEISCAIASATGEAFRVKDCFSAAGGCINRSLILVGDNDRRFFVKINKADLLAMFEAESEDLFMLANARSLRVPVPLTYGLAAGESFLVMEWLHLSRRGDGQKLGEQLAWLHRNSWHAFGWPHDNTIGGTHQVNRPANDWVQFYRNQRLRPQLELAARHGAASNLIDAATACSLALVVSFRDICRSQVCCMAICGMETRGFVRICRLSSTRLRITGTASQISR